ncbi:BA14K family protein [Aestuariivirga sp.]|uniref:BA14K family protein n=1 Tax=Aestuariivirga sp. TaxID=2650926 RepID=UPI00391C2129
MLRNSLIALAALGAGIVGFSTVEASAFTLRQQTPVIETGGSPLLTEVRHRNDHIGRKNWNRPRTYERNRHGRRCSGWNNHCRHYYRGYYYENPWWVLPLVGAGIALSTRDYDDYDGYSSRHVRWCEDRYRSYNPRNNTWVSYSGRVRECVSPYGP